MMTNDDKTFKKITNNDIYIEIQKIKLCVSMTEQRSKMNQRFIYGVVGFLSAIIVTAIGVLL